MIDSWQVIKLFKLLPGDEYKELRHAITRYALLEDAGEFMRFSIYDKGTQQAVDHMLEEFSNDIELVDKIRELEEERDRKKAENEAYQTEKQAIKDEILAQMK